METTTNAKGGKIVFTWYPDWLQTSGIVVTWCTLVRILLENLTFFGRFFGVHIFREREKTSRYSKIIKSLYMVFRVI